MSNKQQFFVFHGSFEASYQSIIEEINLELGTAHVIHMPLPQTFRNPLLVHAIVCSVIVFLLTPNRNRFVSSL